MKKLGVVLVPGPCSLPENIYSIPGECEKENELNLKKYEKLCEDTRFRYIETNPRQNLRFIV